MLGAIEEAGDDLGGIITAFATATPTMLDALYAYDRAGEEEPEGPVHPPVLPEREVLERRATESEVLMATLEVWSAANPFVALAQAALRAGLQEAPIPIVAPQPMHLADAYEYCAAEYGWPPRQVEREADR